jgi:hypothetical protein
MMKVKILKHYGAYCHAVEIGMPACPDKGCNLQIDHVHNDGALHREALGDPQAVFYFVSRLSKLRFDL